MKKLYVLLVTLVVALFASNALASYTPPASPAPKSWISDTSGVLSPEAHARLDAKLKVINQSSANEIAALILPTLDGADIADVGDLTAKSWGVGKKDLDNGVLVVLAMKEHKSRISTGKGVEGDLPDLKANDILVQARPYLRKGDVEGALGFIFDSASSAIANHKAEAAAAKTAGSNTSSSGNRNASCQVSSPGANSGSLLTPLIVVLGLGGLLWYLAYSTKRRRQEEEERERQAREARVRLRQKQIADRETQRKLDEEREAHRKAEQARLQQEAALKKAATPVVETPVVRPVAVHRPAPQPVVHHAPSAPAVAAGVTVATGVALAAAEEEARRHRAEEARRRREREEEDARRARERAEEDRRRRERDEEDRRRRERDEEDRRRRDSESSYSSSSSSFDWGGSSGGGSDSGGFGGGDSGGGGSSSDW